MLHAPAFVLHYNTKTLKNDKTVGSTMSYEATPSKSKYQEARVAYYNSCRQYYNLKTRTDIRHVKYPASCADPNWSWYKILFQIYYLQRQGEFRCISNKCAVQTLRRPNVYNKETQTIFYVVEQLSTKKGSFSHSYKIQQESKNFFGNYKCVSVSKLQFYKIFDWDLPCNSYRVSKILWFPKLNIDKCRFWNTVFIYFMLFIHSKGSIMARKISSLCKC
jgi:hypothetical protein